MKWYLYGEVFFDGNGKRVAASKRLNNIASRAGFVAEVWPLLVSTYGDWPTGNILITGVSDTGASVPGLRFCYSTTNPTLANEAFDDIAAMWEVFDATNSWWAYAAVTV